MVLSPRDFIVYRMTDQLVTDATFASRSGLYDFDGNAVRELAGPALGKLPSVVPSDTVVGQLKPVPAAELGLRPGVPIVIGAGDRQCEVLGSGASEHYPMVSWGTTANVSVPVQERPVPSPAGAVVTRGADGGWLLEGGLSAAGSFLAWLGRLPAATPTSWGAWRRRAARVPAAWSPCRGSTVPAPRGGATMPGPASWAWARRTAPADMARAVVESVAWDVVRVMEVVTVGRLGGSTAEGVTLGGAGSGLPVWVEVLTSVLGLPALRHRSGEAASAGAALLAGKALGMGLTLDQLDPIAAVIQPNPASVEIYRALRPRVDHVAWPCWPPRSRSRDPSRRRPEPCGSRWRTGVTGPRSRSPTAPRSSRRGTNRDCGTRRPPSRRPCDVRWPVRRSATWRRVRRGWPSCSPT